MRLKLLYAISSLLFLSACGLHYSTVPTPINQSAERRKAINIHLTEMFTKENGVYADMAWGETRTVKPLSYKQLDSLYAIKYDLERQGKRNFDLEDQIKIQRQVALNDTSPILYLEDHLFSVTKNNVLSVYSAAIETDKNHKILNADIHESHELEAGMMDEYKIYTFEESFINRGYLAEKEEKLFYTRFKTRADQLTGSTKDVFINHTLRIMQRARTARTVKTKTLIEEIVRYEIHKGKNRTNLQSEKFESMEETVTPIENGGTVVSGYQIVYTYQVLENGMTTTFRHFVQLSPYFEIEKNALI